MGIKVGQYFIEKGLITEKDLESALEYQKKNPAYLGEILLKKELVPEIELLHYLSKRFNVQYISSEKLEKMAVQNPADIIPERLALEKNIFPLKYSFNSFRLTLLTYEPQNIGLFDELKILLTGVNSVVPVVASSAAVKALIYRQYRGDLSAFERLVKKGVDLNLMTPGNESVIGAEGDNSVSGTIKNLIAEDGSETDQDKKESFSMIINQGEIIGVKDSSSITASMISLMPGLGKEQQGQTIELIRIFSNLLDTARDDSFFGHSQRVATLCQELAHEMNLSEVEIHDLVIAAYLHDVGKKHHVTAMDIKHRTNPGKLVKYAQIASKLFNTVELSKLTLSYLANIYETYNGAGLPHGLRLNEVPTGSLILLISDTFDYMTRVSNIPANTVYTQIKDLLFFPEKLVVSLKKVQQIDSMPANKATLFEGIIISRNRFDTDDIAEKLNRLSVKTYRSDIIEKAAQTIKEKKDILNFVLCDLEMPDSKISPLKLLAAMKHKPELSEIPFYFFSQFSVDKNILTAARALKVSGIFTNYHPIEMTRKIVEEIKKSKNNNRAS